MECIKGQKQIGMRAGGTEANVVHTKVTSSIGSVNEVTSELVMSMLQNVLTEKL